MIQTNDSLTTTIHEVDTAPVAKQDTPKTTIPRPATRQRKDSIAVPKQHAVVKKQTLTNDTVATKKDSLSHPAQSIDTVSQATDTLKFWEHSFLPLPYKPTATKTHIQQGVEGTPIPYSVVNDNLVSGLLIGCFIVTITILSVTKHFLKYQFSNFFKVQRGKTTEINETSTEIKLQFFLGLQTCLLIALLVFFYLREADLSNPVVENGQLIFGITGIVAAYYMVKIILYTVVNGVFFKSQQCSQWLKIFLLLVAAEGLAFFPLVLLKAYANISNQAAMIYILIVVIVVKILSIYKINTIFFRTPASILQLFLYLCTLEIVPLAIAWGLLRHASNSFTL